MDYDDAQRRGGPSNPIPSSSRPAHHHPHRPHLADISSRPAAISSYHHQRLMQATVPAAPTSIAETERDSRLDEEENCYRGRSKAPSPSFGSFDDARHGLPVLGNLKGYLAQAFLDDLPQDLQDTVDKKLQRLAGDEINQGVRPHQYRRVQGGLDLQVTPNKGKRPLTEVAKIPAGVLEKRAAEWCRDCIPQAVQLSEVYRQCPGVFQDSSATHPIKLEEEDIEMFGDDDAESISDGTTRSRTPIAAFAAHPNALPGGPFSSLDPRKIRFGMKARDFATDVPARVSATGFHLDNEQVKAEADDESDNWSNRSGSTEPDDGVATPRAGVSGLQDMSQLSRGLHESLADIAASQGSSWAPASSRRTLKRKRSVSSEASNVTVDFVREVSTLLQKTILPTAASALRVTDPQLTDGWEWVPLDSAKEIALAYEAVLSRDEARRDDIEAARTVPGIECVVWARSARSRKGMMPVEVHTDIHGGHSAFLRAADFRNTTGCLGMVSVFVSPWHMPFQSLHDFSSYQEFSDGARGDDFTTVDALWAILLDICRGLGVHHFAISTYQQVILGCFSSTYHTGFATQPISTAAPPHAAPTLPPFPGTNLIQPNAVQMLAYWMRSSVGSFQHQWIVPEYSGILLTTPPKLSPDEGPEGYEAIGLHETSWEPKPGRYIPPAALAAITRQLNPMLRGMSDESPTKTSFAAVRGAQVAQSLDNKAKAAGQPMGVLRTFRNRDTGLMHMIQPELGGDDVRAPYSDARSEIAASVVEAGSLAGEEGIPPSGDPGMNVVQLGAHTIRLSGNAPSSPISISDSDEEEIEMIIRPSRSPPRRVSMSNNSDASNGTGVRSATASTKVPPMRDTATPAPPGRVVKSMPKKISVARASATPAPLVYVPRNNKRAKSVAFAGGEEGDEEVVDDGGYGVAGPSSRGLSIPPWMDEDMEIQSSPIRRSDRSSVPPERLIYPVTNARRRAPTAGHTASTPRPPSSKRRKTFDHPFTRRSVSILEEEDEDEDDRATPIPTRPRRRGRTARPTI